jgi:N-acetylglucosaminyl-diphospho-decaprenol L-rhamnosyltransferase
VHPTPPGDRATPVSVSVIIVTWNCRDAVLACLASLEAAPPSVAWEAVVVDNGSVDGTPEGIRAAAPWVRVISNAGNRGLPAANNQGFVAARGADFVVSNPDVVWQPGAVDALLDVLARRPRAAWVVPRLRYPDGALQTSAGDLPSLASALGGRQLARARQRHDGVWWDGWEHDEEREIGRGHEAAYAVRRRAVEEVGLQAEQFPLDWEGVEWTARLRSAGWEIWLCPKAEAVHVGGASVRQVPGRWVVSSHRGMYRYFAPQVPVLVRPLLAAGIAVRAGAKLVAGVAGVAIYERAHRSRRRRRGVPS